MRLLMKIISHNVSATIRKRCGNTIAPVSGPLRLNLINSPIFCLLLFRSYCGATIIRKILFELEYHTVEK